MQNNFNSNRILIDVHVEPKNEPLEEELAKVTSQKFHVECNGLSVMKWDSIRLELNLVNLLIYDACCFLFAIFV